MESGGLLDWLGRLFWRLIKCLFLLGLSTISYAAFYQFAMPLQHSVKELQFDYTGETLTHLKMEQDRQRQSQAQQQQRQQHEQQPPIVEDISAAPAATQLVAHRPAFLPRHLVYKQKEFYEYQQQQHNQQQQQQKQVENLPVTPTAVIDLYAKHNNWCAMEPSVLPETQQYNYHPSSSHQQLQRRRRLKPQQAYYVEIVLHLPESTANRDAGMFGVVTELYGSSSNDDDIGNNNNNSTTLLAVARRSSRFPHTTPWISTVLKMVLLLPILLQALPEARTVTVPAFRQYVETAEHPLVRVYFFEILDSLFVCAFEEMLCVLCRYLLTIKSTYYYIFRCRHLYGSKTLWSRLCNRSIPAAILPLSKSLGASCESVKSCQTGKSF